LACFFLLPSISLSTPTDMGSPQWVQETDAATLKPYWRNISDGTRSWTVPDGWTVDPESTINAHTEAAKKAQNLYFLAENTLQGEQKKGVVQCLTTWELIVQKFDIIWKMRPSIEIPTTLELVDTFHGDMEVREVLKGELFEVLEKRWNDNTDKSSLDRVTTQLISDFCKSVRNLVDPLAAAATAMLDVERNRLQNAWSQLMALCLSEEVSLEGEHAEDFKKYDRQRVIDLKKLLATAQIAQDKLKGVMQDGYEMGYINDSVLNGKKFFEWHKKTTQPAIDAVYVAEIQLQLVRSQIAREIERKREMRELVCMRQEEKYTYRKIKAEKEKLRLEKEHEKFINSCRSNWEKGAGKLEGEKLKAKRAQEQQQEAKECHEKKLEEERQNKQKVAEGTCVTPWEGVKVGCSVETLEILIGQETARRRNQEGRDFHVDDRDHESKENLLALVVWTGYLVRYFMHAWLLCHPCTRFSVSSLPLLLPL
jgi:hypothetical protein